MTPSDNVIGNSEDVRALDWLRCSHISPEGEQCHHFYRVTPSSDTMCQVHTKKKPSDADETKKRYIDIINRSRTQCHALSYDDLLTHIHCLESQIEATRAELLSAKAVQAEKLEGMDAAEQQKRRRVVVPKSSPIEKSAAGNSAAPSEKSQTVNEIVKRYKKTALEAEAIYGLMKKSKLSMEAAVSLMED